MEDTLRDAMLVFPEEFIQVLILVLMEDTLRAKIISLKRFLASS